MPYTLAYGMGVEAEMMGSPVAMDDLRIEYCWMKEGFSLPMTSTKVHWVWTFRNSDEGSSKKWADERFGYLSKSEKDLATWSMSMSSGSCGFWRRDSMF